MMLQILAMEGVMDITDIAKRLEALRQESAEILGMVNEISTKIRLYQSIDDEEQREQLINLSGTEDKMRKDVAKYKDRLNEIHTEIESIKARINGEIQKMG